MRPALAARLQGSAEMFDHHRRRPWASVNFVTAHDGFTLEDLVSYSSKHNEANGEDSCDGADDNESSNWGEEGVTENADILAQREKIKRNLLATLLFAHGTPMLLAGDEFGQTQRGNNNAYCQDSELSWLDWSLPATQRGAALKSFLARIVALRRAHPGLRGFYFQHARIEFAPGLRDIHWFDERGTELQVDEWNDGNARLLGLRRVTKSETGELDVLVLLTNSDGTTHRFKLPEPVFSYSVLVDTHNPQRIDVPLADGHCRVAGHSLILLAARVNAEEIPPARAEGGDAADILAVTPAAEALIADENVAVETVAGEEALAISAAEGAEETPP